MPIPDINTLPFSDALQSSCQQIENGFKTFQLLNCQPGFIFHTIDVGHKSSALQLERHCCLHLNQSLFQISETAGAGCGECCLNVCGILKTKGNPYLDVTETVKSGGSGRVAHSRLVIPQRASKLEVLNKYGLKSHEPGPRFGSSSLCCACGTCVPL